MKVVENLVSGTSALDIAAEVYETVTEEVPECDVRVVGGIGAAAIIGHDYVDTATQSLHVAPGTFLPTRRANGTLRDLDLFLFDVDASARAAVYNSALRASGGRLVISLSHAVAVENAPESPRRGRELIDADTGLHFHQVGPFRAAIPSKALEVWHVALPSGGHFSIRNPRFEYLSYHIRRMKGTHPKDNEDDKLAKMRQAVESIDGLYSQESDAEYKDLERLAAKISELHEMSLSDAYRTYSFALLRHKLLSKVVHTSSLTDHFQRHEEQKYLHELAAAENKQLK